MVKGLDRFREYFAGHEDGYALIGGAACDILFGEAGLPFRATKDFDIVLCVEVVSVEFGTVFADFLEAGGYQPGNARPAGENSTAFIALLTKRSRQ